MKSLGNFLSMEYNTSTSWLFRCRYPSDFPISLHSKYLKGVEAVNIVFTSEKLSILLIISATISDIYVSIDFPFNYNQDSYIHRSQNCFFFDISNKYTSRISSSPFRCCNSDLDNHRQHSQLHFAVSYLYIRSLLKTVSQDGGFIRCENHNLYH